MSEEIQFTLSTYFSRKIWQSGLYQDIYTSWGLDFESEESFEFDSMPIPKSCTILESISERLPRGICHLIDFNVRMWNKASKISKKIEREKYYWKEKLQ